MTRKVILDVDPGIDDAVALCLALFDPRLRALIHKVKGESSREFDDLFPQKQPSRVVVRTTNGSEYEVYLEYPKGDPREPMTDDDLDNKFDSLTDVRLTAAGQARIRETIGECEHLAGPGQFMAAMVADQ